MTIPELLATLDDYDFDDVDETERMKHINFVVKDICGREPWPFLDAEVTLTAGAGNNQYDTTTGKVTVTDLRAVNDITFPSLGTPVVWWRRSQHMKLHAKDLTRTGDPWIYFFKGRDLYLYPIPQSGNVILNYVREQPTLTAVSAEADILLPAKYHHAILEGVLERLCLRDEDAELASVHKSLKDEILVTMRQDLWITQYDRPDNIWMFTLDPEDDYDY